MKYVIIVAGGTGSRVKSNIPKQFIEVNGKPIIAHTISRFFEYDKTIQVIIVSHKDYVTQLESLLGHYFPDKNIIVTTGGETRFHSVKNGLSLVTSPDSIVAIHDAARPMVNVDTISNCFELAQEKGNATPVIKVNESLRYSDDKMNKAVDRDHYRIIQTPQCFKTSLIKKAFQQDYSDAFTDDASVLEKMGEKIYLAEGNLENIKITTPFDLKIAELFLK